MKVPIKWLEKYVKIPVDLEEFASEMILSGMEVEEMINLAEGLEKVVVARIEKLEKHPNADKLQICTMNIGAEEPLMIVTGATNVFEGAYVPAALDGSLLPNGVKIKTSKLRGVESQGMLCSGGELCIGDEVYPGASVNGILILKDDVTVGTPIAEVLGMDDMVIDFKITANRADCLSVIGLAREAGAVLNAPVSLPSTRFEEGTGYVSDSLKVDVQDTELCPRYMARVVKNVRLAPSPAWMQKELNAAGVRAINNIVDITNYVMLELGQPLHAFDYRHVANGHIIVRRASQGEILRTLDEKDRNLTSSMLVIADEEKPIALAGIMGGEYSGIEEDTTRVIFEAANFEWSQIRVTSRTLGMRTESSARFEKGLPPQLAEIALNRAMALVRELDCGEIEGGFIDVNNADLSPTHLSIPCARINAHLGQNIDDDTMVSIMKRLGFTAAAEDGVLNLEVPYWRRDMETFADVAEEIQRLYGYDKIPSIPPPTKKPQGHRSEKQKYALMLKKTLVGLGLYEAVNYSFMSSSDLDKLLLEEDDFLRFAIRLLNPLGEEYSLMRTTLIPALLRNVATNQNRKNTDIRLFELNRVFQPHALPLTELPDEPERLAFAIADGTSDFFTVKGIVEELLRKLKIRKYDIEPGAAAYYHPGRSATLMVNGQKAGELGELHPDAAQAWEISGKAYIAELDLAYLESCAGHEYTVKSLPKYPAVTRDLSVSVDAEQNIGPMLKAIEKAGGDLVEDVTLFDIYQGAQAGEGRKSVAFKITMRSAQRTLVDEDANACFNSIVSALEKKFGAVMRK